MPELLRKQLGDYSSVVCLKAIITGMEDVLGEKATAIALTAAGRNRGKNLAKSLGLTEASLSLDDIAYKLRLALGEEGTRLCIVEKIEQDKDVIKVYATETVCSVGELQGAPRLCTFTLGAVWGALESILGKRFRGKHVESVLRGSDYDVFEFTPF